MSQRASDGLWVGSFDLGWHGGKRKRRTVYAKTQREAVRKLAAAKREYDVTGHHGGASPTVQAWLTEWLDEIAPRRVRPSTLAGYHSKVTQYLTPAIGHHRLDKLRPEHVRGLDRGMEDRGLSPATRRQTHAILARALTVAHREGKVARNVAELVDAPSVPERVTEYLNSAEIARVLDAVRGEPLESRWLAALVLGLRQGEALGLSWDDVDLDAGTLTIRQALQRIKGKGLVMVEPKSRKSKRTVPLPVVLAKSLTQLPRCGPLVWCRADGTPIPPREDWQAWTDLLDRAGVRHVRLHDARHAAATVLMGMGVHQFVAADILGHATTHMTARYSHSDLTMMREALSRIDAAYAPKAIEG